MTGFSFTPTIPAAPNNPSNDQPLMLINNQSTNDILAVDHVTFNTANGGQHLQVTFNSKNVPGAQIDPQSVLYTNSGTASSVAQPFYINQNGTFQVSPIKAWGYCSNTGAIIASQSINVASVVAAGLGRYNVTLTANAVNSANFAVFISPYIASSASGVQAGYNLTGIGTFQLVFLKLDGSAFVSPPYFSFQVVQI